MNLEKDVRDELVEKIDEFKARKIMKFYETRGEIEKMLQQESLLAIKYGDYWKSSTDLSQGLDSYITYKSNSGEGYMLDKILKKASQALWQNEDRAKQCDQLSRQMNENLKLYRSKLDEFKDEFIDMERLKFDTLLTSLNCIVLHETSCDMNNKYDTKGFQKMIDNINREEYLDSINLSKFDKSGKYSFLAKDEI